MVPDQMIIQIHPLLEEHCISAAIRHEILHEYFNHLHRSLEYFLKKGIITEQEYKSNSLNSILMQLTNIAGDFNISQYYTPEDKEVVRKFIVAGKEFCGLVVEDHHPD